MEQDSEDLTVKFNNSDQIRYVQPPLASVKYFRNADDEDGNIADEGTSLLGRHSASYSDTNRTYGQTDKSIFISIGFTDICQKIVYVSLLANFILFAVNYLRLEESHAVYSLFGIYSLVWLTSGVASIFIELYVVKSTAIIFGFLMYTFSCGILAVVSSYLIDDVSYVEGILAVLGFVLFVVAEAICRTQLTEFGKDQFGNAAVHQQFQSLSEKLYWIGHVIALLIIAVILAVQQFVDFKVGYFICTAISLIGLIAFSCNWRHYTKLTRKRVNPLRSFYAVIREARTVSKAFSKTKTAYKSNTEVNDPPKNWLHYAMIQHGGTYEEADVYDVQAVSDAFLLFATFIPCWGVFVQVHSTFFLQALHLNLSIFSLTIPISWLSLLNIITALILVPTLDKVVYPKFEHRGHYLSSTCKLIVGMVAGILSMVLAGCIQMAVVSSTSSFKQAIGDGIYTSVENIHVLWQVPQHVLLATSEVFMGLTAIDLAQRMGSGGLQRLVTSFYYLMMSFGSLLSLVLIAICFAFPKNHVANIPLEIYFFVLAAVLLMSSVCYLVVLRRMIGPGNDYLSGQPQSDTDYIDQSL